MPQAQSVELPKRLPLIVQAGNRSNATDKDAKLVNCYAESTPELGGYIIEKRMGTVLSKSVSQYADVTGNGIFSLSIQDTGAGKLFVVAGNVEYLGPTFGPIPIPFGPVQTFLNQAGTTYISVAQLPATSESPGSQIIFMLGFAGASVAYVMDGSFNAVPITDPNFPGIGVPGIVYLDGTMYVMDSFGNIWGTLNLDDPTLWDPLNVIVANSSADLAISLQKQLVYVVAVKRFTTQFFYDAGNPTGSPLSPVPGALLNYGCFDANTIQTVDDLLIWLSYSKSYSPQVMIIKNLQPEFVSTPAIERLLGVANFSHDNGAGPTTPASQFVSFSFRLAGHRFYGITNVTRNITLVYDIDQRLWYQWTDADGNYFPVMSVAPADDAESLYVQRYDTGDVYIMQPDYLLPNDNGAVFPVDIITPSFDASTDRGKQLNIMWVNADQVKGSYLKMRWSGDDYQTWSDWRLFNLGVKKPMLPQHGTFTKRAFHFRHQSSHPFRCMSIGLQLDLCTL